MLCRATTAASSVLTKDVVDGTDASGTVSHVTSHSPKTEKGLYKHDVRHNDEAKIKWQFSLIIGLFISSI